VGFSSAIIPQRWRLLYALNPMVGVIDGFRWSLLGGQSSLDLMAIFASVVITLVVCLTGIRYFRQMEKTFADVI
jgi:lipopolysaccharide transport system permease protein